MTKEFDMITGLFMSTSMVLDLLVTQLEREHDFSRKDFVARIKDLVASVGDNIDENVTHDLKHYARVLGEHKRGGEPPRSQTN